MKKLICISLFLVVLVGCGPRAGGEGPAAPQTDLESQLAQKDAEIADLEEQLQNLNELYDTLQGEYDALEASSQDAQAQTPKYLCDEQIPGMKYQNPIGAIAIVEGWFATQPEVQEMQGTFSTTFWNDVYSRVHTIRYVSSEDGLSTTSNFLIFFNEAGWNEGLLWMTEQCWLDAPY